MNSVIDNSFNMIVPERPVIYFDHIPLAPTLRFPLCVAAAQIVQGKALAGQVSQGKALAAQIKKA